MMDTQYKKLSMAEYSVEIHVLPSCHLLNQYNNSTSVQWNIKRCFSWILIGNCRMIFVWGVHQVN